MKRIIAKSVAIFAQIVVTATLAVTIVHLTANAGGSTLCEQDGALYSIDCDGDGDLDITDAACLLNYLFLGGSPPPQVCLAGSGFLSADEESLLQEILPHLSIELLEDGQGGTTRTIRFSGVNVQIVNGSGATNGNPDVPTSGDPDLTTTNRIGNLIVGYNELGHPGGDLRTGSHNVVLGLRNNYTSFGGLVVGRRNTISGPYSSISGGSGNKASAFASSVGGGQNNEASGITSSVGAGFANTASGQNSSVSGGTLNTATGSVSSVSGGRNNEASGIYSVVSGGQKNHAASGFCWIGGGQDNTAGVVGDPLLDVWASVTGGQNNLATGRHSSVSGGLNRNVSGDGDWAAGSLFESE